MRIFGQRIVWWQWIVAVVVTSLAVGSMVAAINASEDAEHARWKDKQNSRQIDTLIDQNDTLIDEGKRKDKESAAERRELLDGQKRTNDILAAVLENLRRRGIYIDPGILAGLNDTHSDDAADRRRRSGGSDGGGRSPDRAKGGDSPKAPGGSQKPGPGGGKDNSGGKDSSPGKSGNKSHGKNKGGKSDSHRSDKSRGKN